MISIIRYGSASFKLKNGIVVYIDPYGVPDEEKADLILLSHDHAPHFSVSDIERLRGDGTVIIGPARCGERVDGVRVVSSGDIISEFGIRIMAIDAYNNHVDRRHHIKGFGFGYVLQLKDVKLYFVGDSDIVPEMMDITDVDYLLIPIGGGSVMGIEEAAEYCHSLKPKVVIPYHYLSDEGHDFRSLVSNCEVRLM